jgi:hypothetical protein
MTVEGYTIFHRKNSCYIPQGGAPHSVNFGVMRPVRRHEVGGAIRAHDRRHVDSASSQRKTRHDYAERVKDLATFLGRSPGTAEAEDVRRFRLI